MKLKMFQVDAFANHVFEGNPAAVCPLEAWLDDSLLQAIAEENNLSETAFFVPMGNAYELRWFTPADEVDLCGHATLAAAHVLYTHLHYTKQEVVFHTRSGPLTVTRSGTGFCMDFPAASLINTEAPSALVSALGKAPKEVLSGFDYLVVFDSEEEIKSLKPLNKTGMFVSTAHVSAPPYLKVTHRAKYESHTASI